MKKLLSVILTLAIIVGLLSVFAMPIGAAALGTSPNNSIVLTDKKWHTRAWTSSNYDAKCYNKIVVPSNGYIEFVLEKPVEDEGEVCSYEVQYSTSKKFKSAKVKKIKSYKTTSLTIKSLKAKKTYYVRVRTFKKVDGKTYYSSWSTAKYKKTK